MSKDYDYDDYISYMNSLRDYVNYEVSYSQESVQKTLNTLSDLQYIDLLEAKVSSKPSYSNIHELLTAIKGM